MTAWIDRLVNQLNPHLSHLYIIFDADNLLAIPELTQAIIANGFEIVRYEDPIAFRYRFEAEIRPQLAEGNNSAIAVNLADTSWSEVPYDLLAEATAVQFRLHDLAPQLSPAVLADIPRDQLGRVIEAAEQLPRNQPALSDRQTILYLLQDVYGIVPSTLVNRENLVRFMLEIHYERRPFPERLAFELAHQLAPAVAPDVDLASLLTDRDAFLGWFQSQWDGYVQTRTGRRTAAESTVPFDASPVRVYLNNLFLEDQLHRVEIDVDEVPDWMSVGVIRPGDDPVRRVHDQLEALDGAWPDHETATFRDWFGFAPRWGAVRSHAGLLESGIETILDRFRRVQAGIDDSFSIWLPDQFGSLGSLAVTSEPVTVLHIADVIRRQLAEVQRVALIVLDGMAYDHWITLRSTWEMPDSWEVHESGCFAWVPTVTSISRQVIFSGRIPQQFEQHWQTTQYDSRHWERLASDFGLSAQATYYDRVTLSNWNMNQKLVDVVPKISDSRLRMLGLVVTDLDGFAHKNSLGLAEMHSDLELLLQTGRLQSLVTALVDVGFAVFLTSDHGSVEATGEGQPNEGLLVESRSLRARVYSDLGFAERTLMEYPHAKLWPPVGMPKSLHVVIADGYSAFAHAGERVVAHGGTSIEEVIVPFVRIQGE